MAARSPPVAATGGAPGPSGGATSGARGRRAAPARRGAGRAPAAPRRRRRARRARPLGSGVSPMRLLVFHGYLLRGTGSNVYNARARRGAGARRATRSHLLCQERAPQALDWVDAAGGWDGGLAGGPRCAASRCGRPSTGRTSAACCRSTSPTATRASRRARSPSSPTPSSTRYLAANVAAVREVVARARPDVALANHLVMGPAILARALPRRPLRGQDPRQRAGVHRQARPRALPPVRARGPRAARAGVLVGSRHTAESLWAAIDDPALPSRTRLGPPGSTSSAFAPRARGAGRARRLARWRERLPPARRARRRRRPSRATPRRPPPRSRALDPDATGSSCSSAS